MAELGTPPATLLLAGGTASGETAPELGLQPGEGVVYLPAGILTPKQGRATASSGPSSHALTARGGRARRMSLAPWRSA